MAPDDVLEDLADVLGLVERCDDGADRLRPDLVPALDQLDELVDDRSRGGDAVVLALDRQLVAAQAKRAAEPRAQRIEHAVAHSCELGGDLIRDGERSCTRLSVGEPVVGSGACGRAYGCSKPVASKTSLAGGACTFTSTPKSK